MKQEIETKSRRMTAKYTEADIPLAVTTDIVAEINRVLAEELIRQDHPEATQAEMDEIWALCDGNPWNAGILYEIVKAGRS